MCTCVDADKDIDGDDDLEEIDGNGFDNADDSSSNEDAEQTEETVQDRDLATDANEENSDKENADEVIIYIMFTNITMCF